jgi:hypothetical protein
MSSYINPRDISSRGLKALVCLYRYGKPAVFTSGHAFTTPVSHPSIRNNENIIHYRVIGELKVLELVETTQDGCIKLTPAGLGIGRSFVNRIISGDD